MVVVAQHHCLCPIFLYIYIIVAVAVFNNKFNNLHFWTRVPSGQASGMRQGRAWGSGLSFGRPWPSNTRPCPQIPSPARPCTTLNIDIKEGATRKQWGLSCLPATPSVGARLSGTRAGLHSA